MHAAAVQGVMENVDDNYGIDWNELCASQITEHIDVPLTRSPLNDV